MLFVYVKGTELITVKGKRKKKSYLASYLKDILSLDIQLLTEQLCGYLTFVLHIS